MNREAVAHMAEFPLPRLSEREKSAAKREVERRSRRGSVKKVEKALSRIRVSREREREREIRVRRLEQLSMSVGRLSTMGQEISGELKEQDLLLRDVESGMDANLDGMHLVSTCVDF